MLQSIYLLPLLQVFLSPRYANARNPTLGGQNFTECAIILRSNDTTLGQCQATCSGWQIASKSETNIWALPFFGFILPAVVFSMVVPRKRVLTLPDWMFEIWETSRKRFMFKVALLLGSFVVAVIDNVCWVFTIFAFAGPMIVGALEEAVLDFKILERDHPKASPQERLALLSTVVVGNLEVDGDVADRIFRGLLCDKGSVDAQGPLNIPAARVHLSCILDSQMEFADVVGGPVLFYVISFAYALNDGSNDRTDIGVSLALAFGMWWMSLVHVSIVSGCLLASNNPSTLRAVLGNDFDNNGQPDPPDHTLLAVSGDDFDNNDQPDPPGHIPLAVLGHDFDNNGQPDPPDHTPLAEALLRWFPLVYPNTFKSAWLWNRGREKHKWIRRISKFADQITVANQITIAWWEYILIGLAATLLIIIPSILGLIVAYQTPQIGLSCRSVAILIYTCTQIILIFYFASESQRISCLPSGREKQNQKQRRREWGNIRQWTLCDFFYRLCQLFFGLAAAVAIFISTAGTLLEIMGVYRNCLCLANVGSWLNPNSSITLLPDPAQVREKSLLWWVSTGWSAIGFMMAVCLAGWWYQLILRKRFERRVYKIR
jgi:hypothetical protein